MKRREEAPLASPSKLPAQLQQQPQPAAQAEPMQAGGQQQAAEGPQQGGQPAPAAAPLAASPAASPSKPQQGPRVLASKVSPVTCFACSPCPWRWATLNLAAAGSLLAKRAGQQGPPLTAPSSCYCNLSLRPVPLPHSPPTHLHRHHPPGLQEWEALCKGMAAFINNNLLPALEHPAPKR